jgi:hypothetical protein
LVCDQRIGLSIKTLGLTILLEYRKIKYAIVDSGHGYRVAKPVLLSLIVNQLLLTATPQFTHS